MKHPVGTFTIRYHGRLFAPVAFCDIDALADEAREGFFSTLAIPK